MSQSRHTALPFRNTEKAPLRHAMCLDDDLNAWDRRLILTVGNGNLDTSVERLRCLACVHACGREGPSETNDRTSP